jgi:hypothetical protein
MSEIGGLVWLGLGLAGLFGAGYFFACCTRMGAAIEFVLAVYLLTWTWIVAIALLLSPVGLVTRLWLFAAIATVLLVALATWHLLGRPPPPPFRPALSMARSALGHRGVAVLALGVACGLVYTIALALLLPANEGDALAYHLARAAFWNQEHGVGYVANAVDQRLNVNPPNAEIGQLLTMLLSGNDRYVALPQLAAYGALVLSVAGLARRIGLSPREATFGALVFATLPIAAVQASSALNDLVVASFLVAAVLFGLRPGRVSLVLVALALGLAVGTKFTAVPAVPAMIVVIALGRPARAWPGLIAATLAGLALGSAWYAVNLVETGELDGGLGAAADQRVALSLPAITTEMARLFLDLFDLSGAPPPHSGVFPVVGFAVAATGLLLVRRSVRGALGLAAAGAVIAATPSVIRGAFEIAQDQVFRWWVFVGRPETALFERGWGLNVEADPVRSWYGPLGIVLAVAGIIVVVWLRALQRVSTTAVGLALTPFLLLMTFAVGIVWDPFRGRFFIFGFALAAAAWSVFARFFAASIAIAGLGATSLFLALANYQSKPSGLAELWPREDRPIVSVESIWFNSRSEVQVRLRPDTGEEAVLRHLEREAPASAYIAVVARENDFLSPYFGHRLSHHVDLVAGKSPVPATANWLVLPPSSSALWCRASWKTTLALRSGWRVERRVRPDECL